MFVQIAKLIRGIKYPKTCCILYENNANVNEKQKNRVFEGDVLKLALKNSFICVKRYRTQNNN